MNPMQSEALRNIRTLRQIKTGLDVSRRKLTRTTNSLSKAPSEVEFLESLKDRQLYQVLQKERKRFAAQQASVTKSRSRVLRSREKLAMPINRNQALTELRRELQHSCGEEHVSVPPEVNTPAVRPAVSQIELIY